MARETAAQRKEREAQERTQAQQAFLASYPRRLLNLVFEYSNKNPSTFTVSRMDDEQFLFETTVDWAREFVLPETLTEYNQSVFVDLLEAEDALKSYDAAMAEVARKSAVKKAALQRVNEMFNEEERQLLGLDK